MELKPKLVMDESKKEWPKPNSVRKIKSAALHEPTQWHGKLGADKTLNAAKFPKLKMAYYPGDGLVLQWDDGTFYTVPPANIVGMEHE